MEHDVLVAGGANGVGQRLPSDAGDGTLARRVDVHQHDHVGLIEGPAKFVPKMLRARVPVGLEEHQKAFEMADARGLERRANFNRMMAVIVDQGDVVDHSLDVKPAADAGEFFQTDANQVRRYIQIKRYGGGGGGIPHVVYSRRAVQMKLPQVVPAIRQAEDAFEAQQFDIADHQIGL